MQAASISPYSGVNSGNPPSARIFSRILSKSSKSSSALRRDARIKFLVSAVVMTTFLSWSIPPVVRHSNKRYRPVKDHAFIFLSRPVSRSRRNYTVAIVIQNDFFVECRYSLCFPGFCFARGLTRHLDNENMLIFFSAAPVFPLFSASSFCSGTPFATFFSVAILIQPAHMNIVRRKYHRAGRRYIAGTRENITEQVGDSLSCCLAGLATGLS